MDDLLELDAKGLGLKWLIEGVLVEKGLHFLSAPPAGAKSWVKLWLARCICEGLPWFGREVPQGPVLYWDEEMGPGMTATRARKLGWGAGLPFYYLGLQGLKINRPEDLDHVAGLCEKIKPVLLCVDTFTAVHTLREKEADDMKLMRDYFRVIQDTGTTLLVSHHDRKKGAESDVAHERMRGSVDIAAMGDFTYHLDKTGSSFKLTTGKSRHVGEDDKLVLDFAMVDNEDRTRVTLERETQESRQVRTFASLQTQIKEALRSNGSLSQGEIAEAVGKRKETILAVLSSMVEAGLIDLDKSGKSHLYSPPKDSLLSDN